MEQSTLLLVLISPPGSGKSYFSARFVERNSHFIRISSDTVREEMFTQPDYSLEERRVVYETMDRMIEENLQQGMHVILDGNLLTNDDRYRLFDRFKKYGKVIFLTFDIDFDYTLQRAIENGNPLDPNHSKHIRAMYQAFESLDADLPSIIIKPGPYATMEKQLKQALAMRHS